MDLPRAHVDYVAEIPTGSWALFRRENYVSVALRCPLCFYANRVGAEVHAIANDGTVTPSFVCWRVDLGACTWHVSLRLLDWDAGIERTV